MHIQTLISMSQQRVQFNGCLQWMQVVEIGHLADLAAAVDAIDDICFLTYFADASLPLLQAHLCALLYMPHGHASILVGLSNELMKERCHLHLSVAVDVPAEVEKIYEKLRTQWSKLEKHSDEVSELVGLLVRV